MQANELNGLIQKNATLQNEKDELQKLLKIQLQSIEG